MFDRYLWQRKVTGTVFEQTTLQSVLVTAGQIAIGWTALSVLAASAWTLHRAPGRDARLMVEDLAVARIHVRADVPQYLEARSAA